MIVDVPTSGFAKCTYFWFCKMYLLLDLQYVLTSAVPSSDFAKCTYFWCTQFWIVKMYLLLDLLFFNLDILWCTYFWFCKMYLLLDFENVPTSGFSKCTYFWCTQFWITICTYFWCTQFWFFKMYLLLMYPIMSPLSHLPYSHASEDLCRDDVRWIRSGDEVVVILVSSSLGSSVHGRIFYRLKASVVA